MVSVRPAAAAIAVAALLSGCSHPGGGATPAVASEPPAAETQWVDAASRTWRTDLPTRPALPRESGGGIAPGTELTQPIDGGATIRHCSANLTAEGGGGALAMLATGHCDGAPGTPVTAVGRPIGVYSDSRYPRSSDLDAEVALLRLDSGAGATPTTHLGGFPVDGVLRVDTVKQLARGTSLCMQGFRLGVACGHVDSAQTGYMLVELEGAQVRPGDSGGAAWLVDTAGRAVVVGVMLDTANFGTCQSPAPDGCTGGSSVTVAYAEPLMREHNLTIARG